MFWTTFFLNQISIMKIKIVYLLFFFLLPIFKTYGQYDNKYIAGFSTSGFYGSFTNEAGLNQQAFYTELIPNFGFRVYNNLYVFVEGGRSFTTTKNIQEPPTLWMVGIFTRYYFKKIQICDFYTGFSSGLTNISFIDINDRIEIVKNKKLNNPILGIYGGTNIRIYKKVSCSVEFGLGYFESMGFGSHKKLLFQDSF